MNTPVSFELAKLLKEKGFDEVCQQWYSVEGGLYYQDEFDNNRGFIPVCECEAPTIAEVVMWLYEKHGIWIDVYYNSKYKSWDYEYTNINWSQEEVDKKLEEDIHNLLDNIFNAKIKYNSPTEAYEAAIEFTLENLI